MKLFVCCVLLLTLVSCNATACSDGPEGIRGPIGHTGPAGPVGVFDSAVIGGGLTVSDSLDVLGVTFHNIPIATNAYSTTGVIAIPDILSGSVVTSGSSGITITLPTGADLGAYIALMPNTTTHYGMSFDFLLRNAGTGTVTLVGGTGTQLRLLPTTDHVVPATTVVKYTLSCINSGCTQWLLYNCGSLAAVGVVGPQGPAGPMGQTW
jgi:hypothetical protein